MKPLNPNGRCRYAFRGASIYGPWKERETECRITAKLVRTHVHRFDRLTGSDVGGNRGFYSTVLLAYQNGDGAWVTVREVPAQEQRPILSEQP